MKEVTAMYEALDILTVFTDGGCTFSFRDVEVVVDNESVIMFDYGAMSDGRSKRATFYKKRIVGVSRTPVSCS